MRWIPCYGCECNGSRAGVVPRGVPELQTRRNCRVVQSGSDTWPRSICKTKRLRLNSGTKIVVSIVVLNTKYIYLGYTPERLLFLRFADAVHDSMMRGMITTAMHDEVVQLPARSAVLVSLHPITARKCDPWNMGEGFWTVDLCWVVITVFDSKYHKTLSMCFCNHGL